MNPRLAVLSLAAALALALFLGAARADASTILGSPDTSAAPDGFVCATCPAGTSVGFVQFARRGAAVQAPEDGVLVAASVYAKRIAGSEPPRIAVLRPDEDGGVGVTVVESAPLPVSSPTGALHEVDALDLPVQEGDSVGFLFRTGEVDLGVRRRPQPDGAIQSFSLPCEPCGMDGRTGVELLLDALVEPDVDEDGQGDESQDPDGGGLGMDWEDDWFEDFEEGDELDEDLEDDASPRERRRIRLLDRGPPERRPWVAAAPSAEGGTRERGHHPAREPPHGRRAVPDDPDRRQALQARRARAAAPGRHAGRRTRPGPAPAAAHQGGRGLLPPPGTADAGDALGPALPAPYRPGPSRRPAGTRCAPRSRRSAVARGRSWPSSPRRRAWPSCASRSVHASVTQIASSSSSERLTKYSRQESSLAGRCGGLEQDRGERVALPGWALMQPCMPNMAAAYVDGYGPGPWPSPGCCSTSRARSSTRA